ncbi:uncharacterized protein LOC128234715 [Mya arenaria]|uniref:uncharacterized protein LOC128234715 n=1 Tax=Mya arenaria TaxID=6604 RepID=UPI0022E31284|nr:uncharacterized protein LOC128234715 [Mya arenaria]
MATASVYIASDQVYDYCCSKCDEHGKNIEAQHFCPECEHYLCDKCVRLHKGYHRQHTVYGRGDIQKWAGFSMDRCDQHSNKLEVHCDDHQELCCSVCVALNHRQCSSISHLPDLAQGFIETVEFKLLPAAVKKIKHVLDGLRNARMKDQASLKDSYKNILAEIKSFRKEITTMLDQLEKKAVEQLESKVKDMDKSMNDDIEACAQMHDQLKTMMEKVQRLTGKQKETNSYIGYKRCQGQLTKAQSVIHEIEARPKEERILFYPNTKIKTFLQGLDNLGNTVHVYNCISKKYISMDPYIICEMPDGHIVKTDFTGLMLLNSQYKKIAHCNLPGYSYNLCHTIGNEVCVAVFIDGFFTNYSEIHFIKVTRGKLQKVRKFTIDQRCTSIAHHQGRLYLSYGTALYQYTMYGELVKKIYENQEIFKCAVSPDGERIYVTLHSFATSLSLVTLDQSGQVLSTFEDPELCGPCLVCVSPNGHVFVCGSMSNTMLHLDREGTQKLATVADGLKLPESVCFSEQTSSLIVGCDHMIHVLKLC